MVFGEYSMGDQGEGVSQLQTDLAQVGFIIDVDGSYGPQTQSVVQMFQAARGRPDTGIADDATLADLTAAVAEGWTTPSPSITVSGPPKSVRRAPVYTAPAPAPAATAAAAPKPAAAGMGGLVPLAAVGAIAAVIFFGGKGGKGKRRR